MEEASVGKRRELDVTLNRKRTERTKIEQYRLERLEERREAINEVTIRIGEG